MPRLRAWIGWLPGLALSLLMVPGVVRPAAAQSTEGLFNGSAITVDGLTFTVSGCQVETNGGGLGSCGTTNLNAFADIVAQSGSGSIIEIEKNGVGSLFSANNTTGLDELSYTLTVTLGTGSDSKTTVTSAETTLNGSGKSSHATGTVSYTQLTSLSVNNVNWNLWSGSTESTTQTFASRFTSANYGTTPAPSFTQTTTLELTKGSTVALNNVVQMYTKAPEPLSMAVFLVGLGGLGAVRRGRKQRRRAIV